MVMSTDKAKIAAYIPAKLKEDAEAMARSQKRSLSNLIELLLDKAVAEYKGSQN